AVAAFLLVFFTVLSVETEPWPWAICLLVARRFFCASAFCSWVAGLLGMAESSPGPAAYAVDPNRATAAAHKVSVNFFIVDSSGGREAALAGAAPRHFLPPSSSRRPEPSLAACVPAALRL